MRGFFLSDERLHNFRGCTSTNRINSAHNYGLNRTTPYVVGIVVVWQENLFVFKSFVSFLCLVISLLMIKCMLRLPNTTGNLRISLNYFNLACHFKVRFLMHIHVWIQNFIIMWAHTCWHDIDRFLISSPNPWKSKGVYMYQVQWFFSIISNFYPNLDRLLCCVEWTDA